VRAALADDAATARFADVSQCVGDAQGLKGTVITKSPFGEETRAKFIFIDGRAMVHADADDISTVQGMSQLADWSEFEDDCDAPPSQTKGS